MRPLLLICGVSYCFALLLVQGIVPADRAGGNGSAGHRSGLPLRQSLLLTCILGAGVIYDDSSFASSG